MAYNRLNHFGQLQRLLKGTVGMCFGTRYGAFSPPRSVADHRKGLVSTVFEHFLEKYYAKQL